MNKIADNKMSVPIKADHYGTYKGAPPSSFWRRCLSERDFYIKEAYKPSFTLSDSDKIATAGSCFAQKIGYELRKSTASVLDFEPTPPGMSSHTAAKLGFGLYSARYGNIYTSAQWLQLIQDAFSLSIRSDAIWLKNDRWFDGLRATLEPNGFSNYDTCVSARLAHLFQVRRLCVDADVFIFTLGLTERWQNRKSGTVYPIFPNSIAAEFGSLDHCFWNSNVRETVEELSQCITLLRSHNPSLRFILTVSPIPLMATATGDHVLVATSRSKAILRAAIEEVSCNFSGCDYFPSYEVITSNPLLREAFQPDKREVTSEAVEAVMQVFFHGHPMVKRSITAQVEQEFTNCDELLLGTALQ